MQALGGDSSFENVTSIGKLNKEPVLSPTVDVPSSTPVVATAAPAVAAAKQKCLTTSRYLDFWLLGGGSLAIWLLLYIIQVTPLAKYEPVNRHMLDIGATFTMLTLVVNLPHFMWSYKLAYSQGPKFIAKNWQQLLFAPAMLILFMGMGLASFSTPVGTHPVSQVLQVVAGLFGRDTRVSIYPNFGTQTLAMLLIFQFAIVGWHYVKQTFGCVMTYAGYTKYPLVQWQRDLIRWNLFGIWWIFLLKFNIGVRSDAQLGVTFHSLNIPDIWLPITETYLAITGVAVLIFVFGKIYWEKKVLPSPNMIAPYAAMYFWFVPPYDVNNYFALIVPCAHSLQYLCFVYKVESQARKEKAGRDFALNSAWLICSVLFAGFFFVEMLPSALDERFGIMALCSFGYINLCFQIFINVHHYFIDNCIWQKKNQEVKRHLFA